MSIFKTITNNYTTKLGYLFSISALLSLYFLSKITEDSSQFESFYSILFITTQASIIFLFIIVIVKLFHLIKQFNRRTPGSTLSISILIRLLLIAVLPLIFISFFSLKFLSYEFRSSFDKNVDDALNSSLELSKKALDSYAITYLKQSKSVAKLLTRYNHKEMIFALERIRQDVNAHELSIFDSSGFIQGFASENFKDSLPDAIDFNYISQVNNQGDYFTINVIDNDYQITTISKIEFSDMLNYYLVAKFNIPNTVSQLTKQVDATIKARDKFIFLKPKVKRSFSTMLMLVILLACLLLLLSSIAFSNYMVKPIRELVRGTKNISKGNYQAQLDIKRKDDFGTLIKAFNNMAKSLDLATKDKERSRAEAESEKAYLATIIEYINAAVITLDYKSRLLTYNEHAEVLLGTDLFRAIFVEKNNLPLELDNYKSFLTQLNFNQDKTEDVEQEIEINDNNLRRQFVARLTALPSTDALHGGYVVIFNDLTSYWQKQKEAAWEEVARRLAHEIKNPLTPILLAAERLGYKLAPSLDEENKKLLNRSVSVISGQVNSLKNMVDDFSAYAKPVNAKKSILNLHKLLEDIFFLYRGHDERILFKLILNATQSEIVGNSNLIRQIFHNLIKNAIESINDDLKGEITIKTQNVNNLLVVDIIDNGCGIKGKQDIFEPYVSSKEKGTGLGLSIVKKIIEEHKAEITVNNNSTIGATVRCSFPIATPTQSNK